MDSKHLLIIGNDFEYCELLRSRFGTDQISIVVSDLPSCFAKVRSKTPQLILIDAQGSDAGKSLEFLKQLRAYRNDNESLQSSVQSLPVIVLTDKTPEILSLFEEVENVTCIEKPYDPSDLNAKVYSILGL